MDQRRTDKRYLCSDLIKMRWLDCHGSPREEIAVLEGYSNSSATMLIGLAIAEGTTVTLCGGGQEFLATVRKCAPAQNGYLVGVSFGDPSRSYVPEHFLDPSLLSYSVKS